jgi:hypothetical protein
LFSLSPLLRSLLCGLALTPALGLAAGSVREQEIAQCLPGEISTWGDGVDRPALGAPLLFVYKHDDAPSWLSEPQVLQSLRKAAAAWSQCADSTVTPWSAKSPLPSGAVLVQWSEQGSAGNFGLANVGLRTLSLGPAAFALLKQRNPRHDARDTLQMVIAHEMGHLYGLMNHSRRCVDVMSYYHNGKGDKCYARDERELRTVVEYRSALPTACDIQRCRSLNGLTRPAIAGARP